MYQKIAVLDTPKPCRPFGNQTGIGAIILATILAILMCIPMPLFGDEAVLPELEPSPRHLSDMSPIFIKQVVIKGATVFSATEFDPIVAPYQNRNVSFDELVETYTESTHALIEGGADIIMLETIFDTLNAKAAAFAVLKVFDEVGFKLPVMISGTITDASGRTLSGQTTEAFYHSLAHVEPVCFGLNCALGPDLLRPYVETLSGVSEAYVSVHPNAGLPNEFGEYDLGAAEMAAEIADWAAQGFLNIVGGCCGTTPEHIKAIANAVKDAPPRQPKAADHSFNLAGLEAFSVEW